MSRRSSNTPLPASVQRERPAAAEESVDLSDEDQGKEECSSEIKKDTSEIEDEAPPVAGAPPIVLQRLSKKRERLKERRSWKPP
jgi:hypothetical protein